MRIFSGFFSQKKSFFCCILPKGNKQICICMQRYIHCTHFVCTFSTQNIMFLYKNLNSLRYVCELQTYNLEYNVGMGVDKVNGFCTLAVYVMYAMVYMQISILICVQFYSFASVCIIVYVCIHLNIFSL